MLRPWFKRLYRFSPNLQLQFDSLLKLTKPSPDSKLFCAQVRIGGKPVDGNNKYVDFEFMKVDKAANYWNHINVNFIKNNTNYKIFLTTDSQEVIKKAKVHFGSYRLVMNTNNTFHFNLQSHNHNCEEAIGLFVDFFMLSECDMGVVSHSGFGMVPILMKDPGTWKNFFVYSSEFLLYEAGKTGVFWKNRLNYTLKFIPFNKDFFYVHNI